MTRPTEVELHDAERELERCDEEVSRRRADLQAAEARQTAARQRLEQIRATAAADENDRVRAAVRNASPRSREVN